MGRVGTLPAAHLEQAKLPTAHEQLLKQPLHRTALDQPGAELAQYRGIKARIGQLETEQILPVDPGPHRLGGLPVGQPLGELHDRHERQPPRALSRPSPHGEQRAEALVIVESAEHVPHLHVDVALRKRCACDTRRLLRNRTNRLGAQRHRLLPLRHGS